MLYILSDKKKLFYVYKNHVVKVQLNINGVNSNLCKKVLY